MIFCGEKKAITGNIMIDDHDKNLKFFDGERILLTQPHNVGIEEKSYTRVRSWDEIMAYFKQL